MEWFEQVGNWLGWIWAWIDWAWAAAWVLAGMLVTHLVWWRRSSRLSDQESKILQRLATLDNRQREIRRLSEEISRRESTLRALEESLRNQTEQLKPQIDQVRGWLDQIVRGDQETACKAAGPVPGESPGSCPN